MISSSRTKTTAISYVATTATIPAGSFANYFIPYRGLVADSSGQLYTVVNVYITYPTVNRYDVVRITPNASGTWSKTTVAGLPSIAGGFGGGMAAMGIESICVSQNGTVGLAVSTYTSGGASYSYIWVFTYSGTQFDLSSTNYSMLYFGATYTSTFPRGIETIALDPTATIVYLWSRGSQIRKYTGVSFDSRLANPTPNSSLGPTPTGGSFPNQGQAGVGLVVTSAGTIYGSYSGGIVSVTPSGTSTALTTSPADGYGNIVNTVATYGWNGGGPITCDSDDQPILFYGGVLSKVIGGQVVPLATIPYANLVVASPVQRLLYTLNAQDGVVVNTVGIYTPKY